MSKPYHLMTPAERTAARIAKNKALDERIAAKVAVVESYVKHGGTEPRNRAAAVQAVCDIEAMSGSIPEAIAMVNRLRNAIMERSSLQGRDL